MVINDFVIIYIYFAFRSRCCFALFEGYDFRIIDIFALCLLLLLHVGLTFFCLIPWWMVGFRWWTVPGDFLANHPGGCENSPFVGNLRMGKLGRKACSLRCVYLFIYLFIVYSCIYFLFTLKKLFIRSCISSVVEPRGGSSF